MKDIKNYTILNLRKIARENNYTGYTKLNKKDLYDLLSILKPIYNFNFHVFL